MIAFLQNAKSIFVLFCYQYGFPKDTYLSILSEKILSGSLIVFVHHPYVWHNDTIKFISKYQEP